MDSCSSVNILSNPEMLTGIHRVAKSNWIQIVTVGKEAVYLRHEGYFAKYLEPVWYYPEGGANILSLHTVKKYYRVTFDTSDDDAFYVHIHNGNKIRFGSARKGIYIMDGVINQYNRMWKELLNETLDEVRYDTVEQNKQRYPKRLYQRAVRARKFQNIMMRRISAAY